MTHAIKPVHGGMVVLRKQRQRAGAHLAMAFVLSLALLFGAIAPVPVHAHSSMDIQINDGALSTTSLEVTLNLSYGGTLAPTQMRFLNDLTPGDDCPNTGWSSWESYSPTKTWTLLAGDSGTRKVCSQTKIGGTTRSDDDSIEYVSGTYTPEPNPPLGQSCGLDIVLVIDSSSSIDATELAQMKAALILFVNAFLPATPTQIAIVEFNTSAAVTQGFTSDVSALTNAINSAPSVNAGGTTRYTNFDDALYEARMLFPNRSNPDMIVFSSDGNPNRRDGHPGPGHDGVVDSVSTSQAMDWAIYEANEAKSAGIHMLSIGIGSDVSTSNLAMISSASDVITSDFGSLAADLAALASQLCGGTITSHKILDFDGNLATTADQVTSGTDVAGWVYTAANVIGGTVTPTSSTTDTDGVVTLPFDVSMPGAFASLDILETVKPGFAFLGATCSDQDGPKTVTVDIDPNDGVGIDAISVEALDIVTCNFYNYPNPGTLIIKKVVVNDNGGELEPADFSFSVNGGAPVSFEGDGQNELSLPAGTYSVTEPAVSGYTTSYDNCSGLVIPFGGSAICTITNDDQPATLIVKKMLINDNGGGRHVDDFTFSVNGGAPVAFEADGQNNQTVPAGTYTITEPAVDGYSTGYENCSGVVIPPGGSATCTITNDDQVGTLIVKKVVVNDDGGALGAADFSFSVNGGAPVSFESDGQNDLTVPAGTYSITEPAVAGYAASYDNCADVVVPNGGSATCTITNDDQPATLTLVKTVVNNNGGGLDANDFPAFIDGNPVSWNTPVSLPGGATYTASETVQAGYTAGVWGGDCAADGTVSLAVGDSKTCTITNDDQAGTLIVKKVVVNDDGGALGAADFSFSVNGGTSVSFEGDGQNDLTVAAGTYTITEPAVAGYSTSYDNCTDVVVPNGGSATCTITNNDQPATLTLVKMVTNDNGGGLVESDFPAFIDGASVTWGQAVTLNAGLHTASETAQAGYTAFAWGGDCAADGSITLLPGDAKTCTITNDDQAATLTLVKTVINNNGGGLVESDFPAFIDGASVTWGQAVTLDAGEHTASETGQTGYSAGVWGGDCAANGSITLLPGESKTCTITNDDQAATLTLVKTVINDNGGGLTAANFPVFIDGEPASWGVPISLAGGATYTASETSQAGYTASAWGGDCAADGTVSLMLGDSKTCTITNDDQAGTLIVKKVVVNDNGGTLGAADFAFSVDGGAPVSFESDGQNDLSVAAGTYTITEPAVTGYSTSYDNCTDLVIPNGGSATCTITNDDQAATLTLVKTVMNDDGGALVETDFPAFIDGASVTWGQAVTLNAGRHTASETSQPGYTASAWGGDCAADGTVSLALGESKTCTITNDDQAGTLIVKKVVVNDNGGTLGAADFSFSVDGGTPVSFESDGQNDLTVPAGTYSVTEPVVSGYTTSYNNCTDLVIPIGGSATCTITNDDQAATLIVKKVVVNDSGGVLGAADFSFSVNGGAPLSFEGDGQNDLTVPAGAYTVTEPAVAGYTAQYDNCAKVVIPPGGSATCTITNDDNVPELTLEKTAAPTTYDAKDDVIDYSYKLTNSGTVTLYAPYSVTDDKVSVTCPDTPISLAPGESVTCSASYTITQADVDDGSITNIARGNAKDPSGGDVLSNQSDVTVTAEQSTGLTLVKTANPATYAVKDAVIDYSYELKNSGNTTLYAPFTVTDDKVSVTCPDTPASLAPNETIICTASYTITQQDLDDGEVTNAAIGNAKDDPEDGGDVPSNEDSQTVTAVNGPAIDVEKLISVDGGITWQDSDTPTGPNLNNNKSPRFKFEVTNIGNVTLTGISLSDDSIALFFQDDYATACIIPASLTPLESFTCYSVLPWQAGQHTNTATAQGSFRQELVSDTDDGNYFGKRPPGGGGEEEEEEEVEPPVITFTGGFIPVTGFAQGTLTDLPLQPAGKTYANTDMVLKIPVLGKSLPVIGVPYTQEDGWDITWLGNNAGYLEGTAYPTWAGNTVITAHVWDALDQPGPFADLKKLKYGDQVVIEVNGLTYTYEVRESLLAGPKNLKTMLQHEELDWVTLVTCEFYNPFNGDYFFRRLVRAVLVSVE